MAEHPRQRLQKPVLNQQNHEYNEQNGSSRNGRADDPFFGYRFVPCVLSHAVTMPFRPIGVLSYLAVRFRLFEKWKQIGRLLFGTLKKCVAVEDHSRHLFGTQGFH